MIGLRRIRIRLKVGMVGTAVEEHGKKIPGGMNNADVESARIRERGGPDSEGLRR